MIKANHVDYDGVPYLLMETEDAVEFHGRTDDGQLVSIKVPWQVMAEIERKAVRRHLKKVVA